MEALQGFSSHDAAALLEEGLRIKYTSQSLYGGPAFALDKSTLRTSDLADFLLLPSRLHDINFERFTWTSMTVWNVEEEKVM